MDARDGSFGTALQSSRWPARLAALVAGALPALAFPAPDVWILGFVGLVPMLWLIADAVTPAEAAWRGWLGGVGFMAATHQWLVPATGLFTIPAALLAGALWIPWALAARAVLRCRTPARVVAAAALVPAAFVVAEYVRSWDRLGGPWGLLGATQWRNDYALALAALGGVWMVSGFLMAVNVVAVVVLRPGLPRPTRWVAAALAGLLAASMFGAAALRTDLPDVGVMRIGGVQAGVIHDEAERFDRHEALSAQLAGVDLDLVVWAESSVGFDLQDHPEHAARLQALAVRLGAPILVNVDARRSDSAGIAKSAVLVGPTGPSGRYDKMRLVPFGEYIPMRSALGWIAGVSDAAAEDRIRGDRLATLEAAGWQVGPLICFESAFPDLARALTELGADVVVVQTATTTFQGSWAQPQHASLAAIRAAESGRSVVHASVSGVTAVFDAVGHRLLWLEDGVVGAWETEVPITQGTTPYVRYGEWFPALAMAVALVALVWAASGAFRRWRGRLRPTLRASDAGREAELRPPTAAVSMTSGASLSRGGAALGDSPYCPANGSGEMLIAGGQS